VDPRALAEHLRFYQELGVAGVSRDPVWRRRSDATAPSPAAPPAESSEAIERSGAGAPPELDSGLAADTVVLVRSPADVLLSIRTDIGDCTRCKLHRLGRTQVVFGVGNPDASLMFVGEGPGADEDVQGVPFVGRAGQLLTKIIEAIGLDRSDVYIANVVKCRPPENRNPEPDEIETCGPFLLRQIDAVAPRVIVALGTFATKTLLATDDPISRLRGRVFPYRGAQLVPTFHPAFLLRSPDRKRDVWEDMKKVRTLLQDPGASAE
jgi:DNA polymerase